MELKKDKISLLGDILIDLVRNKKDGSFTPYIGGSIFNTALTVNRLSGNINFISSIGDDFWGNYILNNLKDEGIDCVNISVLKEIKTSLAFAVTDSNNNAKYDFYKAETDYYYPVSSLESSYLFHFGSSFCIKKQNKKNVVDFIRYCRDNRIIISYDPNFRMGTSDKSKIIEFIKEVDILKASKEDIGYIFGEDKLYPTIEHIRTLGPKLIVITLGDKGAIASNKAHNYIFEKSPKVRVINTIGAGDNFSAGLIYFLYKNNIINLANLSDEFLRNALKFSNKISAECVKTPHCAIDKRILDKIKKSIY